MPLGLLERLTESLADAAGRFALFMPGRRQHAQHVPQCNGVGRPGPECREDVPLEGLDPVVDMHAILAPSGMCSPTPSCGHIRSPLLRQARRLGRGAGDLSLDRALRRPQTDRRRHNRGIPIEPLETSAQAESAKLYIRRSVNFLKSFLGTFGSFGFSFANKYYLFFAIQQAAD